MKNEVADKIETNRPFLGKYALFLALAASVAATQDGNALQAGSIDSGGTVHVPAMLLPYSRLASEQARARFVEKAREQLPTSNNIDDLRRFYGALNARLAVRMREVFAVSEVHETWNGIEVLRVRPQSGVTADRVLLNLHGGAFMWGGGDGEDVEAIPIAATSRIEVISLNYRLAPEHPYPAAVEDIGKVYRRLLRTYSPAHIGIYGCSAGAILASESIAAFLRKGLPLPGAVGAFCGAALPFAGDSTYFAPYSVNEPLKRDKPETMEANAYFRGADASSATVFPGLSADVLRRFPPTLLLSGTRDQAFSSCVESELALRRAGVTTEMHSWDGMWHAFFVDPDLPESREAYTLIARFFLKHLDGGSYK